MSVNICQVHGNTYIGDKCRICELEEEIRIKNLLISKLKQKVETQFQIIAKQRRKLRNAKLIEEDKE